MQSKKQTTYFIIFNVVMAFLLFLSSQFVLFILNGTIVQDVGIYIEYGFQYTFPDAIPTAHAPLLNYPLFVFVFTMIGNVILMLLLRSENKTTVHSKTIT